MKESLKIILFIILTWTVCLAQDNYKEALESVRIKDFGKAITIAREMFEKDSLDSAIKILLNIREAEPGNKSVYDLLGDAYLKSGVTDLAITNYQKEISVDSTDTKLRFKLASVYYNDKKYTDAVNEYLKILSFEPQNKEALYKAGKIFYLGKLYGDAVIYLEKFRQLDPGNPEVDTCLINSYLRIQKYDMASAAAESALKILPGNIQLIRLAAKAFYFNNNYQNTILYYSQLPDSAFTYDDFISAGKSAQYLKRDSLAVIYLVKAVKTDSTKNDLTMDLGNLYYTTNNFEKARKYYAEKIAKDAAFEPAYRFLGFASLQLKDYNSVKENLKKAVALNDTVIASYFWLAQAYRSMDSTNKAISAFQDVLTHIDARPGYDEEAAESNSYLGQEFFEQKKYGQSINYLIKALKYKPTNVNFVLMLASAYHSSGDTDNAIKYYKKVLSLDPKNEIAKKGLRLLSAD